MAAPTRSSNAPARASLVVGLLGAAALPAAIAASELRDELSLLESAWAAPVAFVLGVLAIWLARRGRRRFERTIGRVGGSGTARAGRLLGIFAVCLGVAGAIAVAFYEYLVRFYE